MGKYINQADPKDQYSYAWIYVEVDLEVGQKEHIQLKVADYISNS